jgi:hypothetical protein
MGYTSLRLIKNYYYKSQIKYYNNVKNTIRMVNINEEKESNNNWGSRNGFSCF